MRELQRVQAAHGRGGEGLVDREERRGWVPREGRRAQLVIRGRHAWNERRGHRGERASFCFSSACVHRRTLTTAGCSRTLEKSAPSTRSTSPSALQMAWSTTSPSRYGTSSTKPRRRHRGGREVPGLALGSDDEDRARNGKRACISRRRSVRAYSCSSEDRYKKKHQCVIIPTCLTSPERGRKGDREGMVSVVEVHRVCPGRDLRGWLLRRRRRGELE